MPVPGKSRKSGRPLAARLEKSILSGKLPPGCKLPGETSLAHDHDLSRAAVREALETLKARGLITSRRGSGSYVAVDAGSAALSASVGVYAALRRDADTYRQLMMLRMFVECECIGVLAEKNRWRSRERLRAALAGMAGKRASLAAFGKADLAFHLTLVEESGYKLYASLLRGLLRGIGDSYARETYVDRSFVDTVLAEHRAICEALDLGRAGGARRALQRHLHHSLPRTYGFVPDAGTTGWPQDFFLNTICSRPQLSITTMESACASVLPPLHAPGRVGLRGFHHAGALGRRRHRAQLFGLPSIRRHSRLLFQVQSIGLP